MHKAMSEDIDEINFITEKYNGMICNVLMSEWNSINKHKYTNIKQITISSFVLKERHPSVVRCN